MFYIVNDHVQGYIIVKSENFPSFEKCEMCNDSDYVVEAFQTYDEANDWMIKQNDADNNFKYYIHTI